MIRAYQSRVATAINQFSGYIARYIGDGVLSYFGWPESKEADAERAVRAALAVVAAVTETPINDETLHVRIGVATGTVVVGEPIGTGEAGQQTAIGRTPNLAARLQEVAEPNSVVIDDVTRRQIGGLFACRDLGALALKGFPRRVRAWRVLEARAVGDRFAALHAARLVPLVGREEELALLLRCWQMARAGTGRLVLLAGDPGIGKSRLVAELRARLRGEPHTNLRYFCSPYYQASPLYPVIARLEYQAGFVRHDGPQDKLRKLEGLLASARPSSEDVSLIADLLGVPVDKSYPKLELSPQRRKYRTFEALARRLAALARQRPLFGSAEDVHWADAKLPGASGQGYRPAVRPAHSIDRFVPVCQFVPPRVAHPNATLITLNRLNRGDAERLATEVLIGRALPQPVLDRIVTQSDGVHHTFSSRS